jgi:hypothetical protein
MSLPPDQRQICFRVPVEKAARVKAAAMREGIREMGPFCRELVEWAFEHYEEALSLFMLRASSLEVPRLKMKKPAQQSSRTKM